MVSQTLSVDTDYMQEAQTDGIKAHKKKSLLVLSPNTFCWSQCGSDMKETVSVMLPGETYALPSKFMGAPFLSRTATYRIEKL